MTHYAGEKEVTCGTFQRIRLTLNHHMLAEALIKSGAIPEGFIVEYAHFEEDSTILEVCLHKETVAA